MKRSPGSRRAARSHQEPEPPSLCPAVLYRQRADFSFAFVSPSVESLAGVASAAWQRSQDKFWSAVHEADRDEVRRRWQEVAQTRQPAAFCYRIRHAHSGRFLHVLERRQADVTPGGRVRGYAGSWQDVTRQMVAEQRLMRTAWPETLGRLTVGMTHDFANILAGMRGLSDRLLATLEAHHPARESLTLISNHCSDAITMARSILNLHRAETGTRQFHDLNQLAADLGDIVGKVLPRQVELHRSLVAAQLPVHVDAVEFRQAVTNLMLNAVDAMPKGGTLTLGTARHEGYPVVGYSHGAMPRLPAVCLTVSDTGCGIKPQHLASIFEPFFTTKAFGKGNGLGLYNARMFVERHGGAISVDSTPGRGSKFYLWLPEANLDAADDGSAGGVGRSRRLLLLGDSAGFAQDGAGFLRVHGYQVAVAATPEAAGECLFSATAPFDGVIVPMDSKDSPAAALLARVRREKLPVKVILHVLGMDPDDLPGRLLRSVDLVIAPEMTVDETLEQLRALFQPQGGKGPSHA